jgi:hypothetical protein
MLVEVEAFGGGPAERRVVAYDGPIGRLVDVVVGPSERDFALRVRPAYGPDVYVPRYAVARVGDAFVLLQGTRREIERIASTRRPPSRTNGGGPADSPDAPTRGT